MPQGRKATRRKRVLWTAGDIRLLRSEARRKPVSKIARQLGRSEAAVRYKATVLKVSLALGSRAVRARR